MTIYEPPKKLVKYSPLKRKKIGYSSYEIVNRKYPNIVYAEANKTGTHLDNYPWEWSVNKNWIGQGHSFGHEQTLSDCIDSIEYYLRDIII